ncbi:MAG TPA: hypothetical protein ENN54_05225 [Thermoplasmatales archaeon]|nr:hypothetical protein [Thermoplasmatales archaeon]
MDLSHRSQQASTIAIPTFSVGTGIPRIDHFMGELTSSHTYLFEGQSSIITQLATALMVGAVQRFGRPVVVIDGGNSLDVYGLAALARRRGENEREVLSTVMVARAFTAYQLDTLIDQLPTFIETYEPLLVVVQHITDLLQDPDMDPPESRRLLGRWLNLLRIQATRRNLITLLTTRRSDATFSSLLRSTMDTIVHCAPRGGDLELHLPQQGRHMRYRPVPLYQWTLDEFGEDTYG